MPTAGLGKFKGVPGGLVFVAALANSFAGARKVVQAGDPMKTVRYTPQKNEPLAAEAIFDLHDIGKIIGVGLNYRDHAAETGLPLPKEPTLFLKPTSALCGPDDDLVMPREAQSVDWEVELGVVIGKSGVYVDAGKAMDHVLGYVLGIDFSERDFQFNRGGQGFKGKSSDTFAPLGPVLATRAEIEDPHDLAMTLSVNGAVKQAGHTRDMIFSVAELVSYISRFMSLQPGDVILTGTPAGVGFGQKPPAYLKPGDVVTAEIDGLGRQTHRVVASR
jgi:2,4-diketo-3-deoxy-L-fuconate hydrolase